MASSSEASCISDPNFAVICAFLERFAKPCGITYPSFVDLQEMLENVEQVPQELIDLHIKLLRKARKTVFMEKWERALIKFCHTYSSQDGWEIEHFGYKKSRLEVKLRVLKMLLEGQFDLNNKFKASINTLESDELRSKPLGRDKLGRIYWLQFDPLSNIRVYREDLDEESWTLVAKDRASLIELLQDLSGEEFPLDLNFINEDSTSLEVDKPVLDTGQNSNSSFKNDEVSITQNSESNNLITEEMNPLDTLIIEKQKDVTNEECKSENNLAEEISKDKEFLISNGVESSECNDKTKESNLKKEAEETTIEEEEPQNQEVIVSEAIEEPVMYVTGEGCGEDCKTGNPELEEKPQDECESEPSEKNSLSEVVEGASKNLPEFDASTINSDIIKPAPKLWSIDTICGVNSSKDSVADSNNLEKQESVDFKIKQKNFSSFSIDSVLERKDLTCSSSEASFSKFSVGCSDKFLSENLNSKETGNLNVSNISFPESMSSEKFQTVTENHEVFLNSGNSKTENLVNKVESNIYIKESTCSKNTLPKPNVDLIQDDVSEKTSEAVNESVCQKVKDIIENEDDVNKKNDVIITEDETKDDEASIENNVKDKVKEEKIEIQKEITNENESIQNDLTKDVDNKDLSTESNNREVQDSNVNCDEINLKQNLEIKSNHEQLNENDDKKEEVLIKTQDSQITVKTEEFLNRKTESMNDETNVKTDCKESPVTDDSEKPTRKQSDFIEKTDCKESPVIDDSEKPTGKHSNLIEKTDCKVSLVIDDSEKLTGQHSDFIEKPSCKELPVIDDFEKSTEEHSDLTEKTNSKESPVIDDSEKPTGHSNLIEKTDCKVSLVIDDSEKPTGKHSNLIEKTDCKVSLVIDDSEKLTGQHSDFIEKPSCKELPVIDDFEKSTEEHSDLTEKTNSKESPVIDDSEKPTGHSNLIEKTDCKVSLVIDDSEKLTGRHSDFIEKPSCKELPVIDDFEKSTEEHSDLTEKTDGKESPVIDDSEKPTGHSDLIEKTSSKELPVIDDSEKLTEPSDLIETTGCKESLVTDESEKPTGEHSDLIEKTGCKELPVTDKSEKPTGEHSDLIEKTETESNDKLLEEKITQNATVSEPTEEIVDPKRENAEDKSSNIKFSTENSENLQNKTNELKDNNESVTSTPFDKKNEIEKLEASVSETAIEHQEKCVISETNGTLKLAEPIEDEQVEETKNKDTEIVESIEEAQGIQEERKELSNENVLEEKETAKLTEIPKEDINEENKQEMEKEKNSENVAELCEKEKFDSVESVSNKGEENVENLANGSFTSKIDKVMFKDSNKSETDLPKLCEVSPSSMTKNNLEKKKEESEITINLSNDLKQDKVETAKEEEEKVEEDLFDDNKETEEGTVKKKRRRRKKGILPQRILSRNRKTTESDVKEEKAKEEKTPVKYKKSNEDKNMRRNKTEVLQQDDSKSIADEDNQTVKSQPAGEEEHKLRRGRKLSRKSRKRRNKMLVKGSEKEGEAEIEKKGHVVDEEIKTKKKGRPRKEEVTSRSGRQIPAREIKLLGINEADLEVPSIRQSRRIAQIKMKEEAERRRIEALQLESFKSKKSKKGKKKSKKNAGSDSYEEKIDNEDDDSDDERSKSTKDGKKSRRKKKKDKLVFNELNPWLSSSGSSSVDEEEEDIEDDPHEDDELLFKSDHEFSPESDIEDPDYKPIKRARTAKVEESKGEVGKYDDTSCEKCGNNDHPEWILLCDKCDKGWHASCVRPALMVVPEGDWFCPPCEHTSLITKLQESLVQFDRFQKQRENEELRKKRLAFVGISLDNVLPTVKKKSAKQENEEEVDEGKEEYASGSTSSSESDSSDSDEDSENSSEPVYQLRERRSNLTSYRYNEYDELIKSALQDEIEAVKGAGNAGRGKDISNIVNAQKEDQEELKGEDGTIENKEKSRVEPNHSVEIGQSNKKEKIKKDDDNDYEVDTEGDEEEENDNVVDEIPPVVPKYNSKKKKSKSVKITSLDFTSEEEDNNSDSDFKGTSSEEESDYSLPSESESSSGRRRKKGSDGPLRRSTRARISRYDRDFINDDSEDDSPKRKKNRRVWDSSESSDSDRSWGRRKRKANKSSSKSPKKSSSKSSKKKKQRKLILDSESEEYSSPKKSKKKRVKYGGLDSPEEDKVLSRRTRGKKINYQEMNGSDSDDDTTVRKSKSSRVIESDDDFVAENEKDDVQDGESEEIESGVDEGEEDMDENQIKEKKKPNEKKKKILEKIKKKKCVIPDPDDFSENDLMEDEQLDEFVEELEDLDEEEEEILGNILESGDVPIHELKAAVKRAKEEKKLKKEAELKMKEMAGNVYKEMPKAFPPIPSHMEFPGGGKFPKIGKVKITPSRAELASQMAGLPPQTIMAMPGKPLSFMQNAAGLVPSTKHIEGQNPIQAKEKELESTLPPGGFLLNTLQGDPKLRSINDGNIPPKHSNKDDSPLGVQRPFMPYQVEATPGGPLNMMAMMNSQQQGSVDNKNVAQMGMNNNRPIPQVNSFQGVVSSPARMPLYPSTIPTTVTAIANIEARKKQSPKVGKRKMDDGSPQPEIPSDGSESMALPTSAPHGEEYIQMKGVQDSPPKKKGRGRGKKQLLAEAQAQAQAQAQVQGKQDVTVATIQAPTQFPPQGLPSEGGSVITRMLNAPQNYPGGDSNSFSAGSRVRQPFRPSLPPHFSSAPGNLPPLRMRVPVPGNPLFHTSHPLDPSPSGGGAINIPVTNSGLTKPSPSGAQLIPRFPSDPNIRHPFPSPNSPPRPEFSTFPNYYGNFPSTGAPVPGSEDSNFQNPPFVDQFSEAQVPGGGTSKPFEEEGSGEFGGLASYFASQREDDLDT